MAFYLLVKAFSRCFGEVWCFARILDLEIFKIRYDSKEKGTKLIKKNQTTFRSKSAVLSWIKNCWLFRRLKLGKRPWKLRKRKRRCNEDVRSGKRNWSRLRRAPGRLGDFPFETMVKLDGCTFWRFWQTHFPGQVGVPTKSWLHKVSGAKVGTQEKDSHCFLEKPCPLSSQKFFNWKQHPKESICRITTKKSCLAKFLYSI